jgi:protein ImuA
MSHPVPDLATLRRQLARLERPRGGGEAVSLGEPALDAALPWDGLPRCGLHDVLGSEGDAAAGGFAMALAGRLAGNDGLIVHVGMRHRRQATGSPYGPGLVRFGVKPDRLILVTVRRPVDLLWTMEESLRSGALAAVIGEGVAADLTASRRLQLAAETGGAAALLLPEVESRSWVALTRWRVASAASSDGPFRPRWRVTLERCRGGTSGDWLVDWDDATGRFCVAPPLADRRPILATAHG